MQNDNENKSFAPDNNAFGNMPDESIPMPMPTEFSSDFIVETNNHKPEEFVNSPEEYVKSDDDYVNSPETEQAATDDRYNDLDGAYGNTYDANDDYTTDTTDLYDLETADDGNSAYNAEYADEFGYEVAENSDPSDENAATVDEFYSSDKPSAREKCKLDDYEIISDVLGSEKEIVKLYSTALCEAAEEQFRNVLRENLDYAAEDQYKAFEFMQQRGMYKTEQASDENITKAKQQFSPLADNCNECTSCKIDYDDCDNCGAECGCDNCCCDVDCD